VQVLKRIMRCHEDLIQSNKRKLLLVSSKITEKEHLGINQKENIMSMLVYQKKRIDFLEAKCNLFHKLELSLCK
jgi:hypothetical protein